MNLVTEYHIITLCGSTKFKEAYEKANMLETLKGNIVLSVGAFFHSNVEAQKLFTDEAKMKVDLLHLEKIRLSDEVIVLNVGGYVGRSTLNEIQFAHGLGKKITYLEPNNIPDICKQYI